MPKVTIELGVEQAKQCLLMLHVMEEEKNPPHPAVQGVIMDLKDKIQQSFLQLSPDEFEKAFPEL
jgi:hypothetical protein